MQQVLLVVQILVAVSLIALILLQQGRGADAGAAFGSGGAGTLFGARGPATLLTRMTGFLAAVFFINSIGLSYLAGQSVERNSVVERFEPVAPATAPVPDAPASEPGTSDSDVPALPGESPEQGTDQN